MTVILPPAALEQRVDLAYERYKSPLTSGHSIFDKQADYEELVAIRKEAVARLEKHTKENKTGRIYVQLREDLQHVIDRVDQLVPEILEWGDI